MRLRGSKRGKRRAGVKVMETRKKQKKRKKNKKTEIYGDTAMTKKIWLNNDYKLPKRICEDFFLCFLKFNFELLRCRFDGRRQTGKNEARNDLPKWDRFTHSDTHTHTHFRMMTVVSPLLYEMISCEFLSSLILQFFKEERERQTTARADGWMKEEETKTTCDPCLNDFSVRKSSFFPPEMREFGKRKKIIRRKQTTPNNNIRSIGIRKNREKKKLNFELNLFLKKKNTNKQIVCC